MRCLLMRVKWGNGSQKENKQYFQSLDIYFLIKQKISQAIIKTEDTV